MSSLNQNAYGNNGQVGKLVRKRVSSLKPSPENAQIYQPDSNIGPLADSILKNGCVPLVVTRDNVIASGHRRHRGLQRNGQKFVLCFVLPKRRCEYSDDEFVALLRQYNQQRRTTVVEQIREDMVDLDPDQAAENLDDYEIKSVQAPELNGV